MAEMTVAHRESRTRGTEVYDHYAILNGDGSRGMRVHVCDYGRVTLFTVQAAYLGKGITFDAETGDVSGHTESRGMRVANREISHQIQPPLVDPEAREAGAVAFASQAWHLYEQLLALEAAVAEGAIALGAAVNLAAGRPEPLVVRG